MAKVISVCNQKGGVGKTTTAINAATYLATFDKKVLLIDLDPQANATSGLGIDKKKVEKSSYDLLINNAAIETVTTKTIINNLCIIPANVALTGAEVELVPVMSREFKLSRVLASIRDTYDYILIDCPPSLGLLTINALAASDSVLIPIQCEYYALEGLTQLLSTINLIRANLNSKLEIEGILLTMADFRTNLTSEVIKEARNFFKEKVYTTVIPRNIKLSEAPSFGKPIYIYDKNSIGASSYYNFTKELLGEKIATNEIKSQEVIQPTENATGG